MAFIESSVYNYQQRELFKWQCISIYVGQSKSSDGYTIGLVEFRQCRTSIGVLTIVELPVEFGQLSNFHWKFNNVVEFP